jgi:hypothetical protein
MSITQTVEIPASRRLTINVPREIPIGRTILTFTPASAVREKMPEAQEMELINRNAEWLNREAEDTLAYQNLDAFEEDLERLAPQDAVEIPFTAMRGAVVPFSLADIVFDRDDERLNSTSGEKRPV